MQRDVQALGPRAPRPPARSRHRCVPAGPRASRPRARARGTGAARPARASPCAIVAARQRAESNANTKGCARRRFAADEQQNARSDATVAADGQAATRATARITDARRAGPSRTMTRSELPADVRRFILTSIPSVPFLEAVLLLRAEPGTAWGMAELARRLYVPERTASELLELLAASGIAAAVAKAGRSLCPSAGTARAAGAAGAGLFHRPRGRHGPDPLTHRPARAALCRCLPLPQGMKANPWLR